MDLEQGKYKIQFAKGPKKHNGVLSVEQELATKAFWRVRLGISQPKAIKQSCLLSAKDYVLTAISTQDQKIIDQAIKQAVQELVELIDLSEHEKI